MATEILWNTPDSYSATFLFAHGAGAGMENGWMTDFAERLAGHGIRVARFEFAYMAARRQGLRKPPPRAETLVGEFRDAVATVGAQRLFIGGKSMGGRVASMVADELFEAGTIAGLVCLGYPFHPPGTPDALRTAHLLTLKTPTLICQGTRDQFGTIEEVPGYGLSPAIELHWLEDGEHGFKPRVKISGRTNEQNLAEAASAVASFIANA